MKHIVKLKVADMVSPSAWDVLIKQLDPTAAGLTLKSVELTVETVFFEKA